MASSAKARCVGILTSGGDCPGLNAAIRGVAKAAMGMGIEVVGILDGFRGMVENRTRILRSEELSGILSLGGTILGTSRDKPHKMSIGDRDRVDMTSSAVATYRRLHLDCLVCLGGGGTQKNALHMQQEGGLNVLTLPKTIDNDVACTDVTFGFDTAVSIATEAIDRLHTTAESHHRVIVVEIMGHRAGWLTLASGVAGGADVILIPEIPYRLESVCRALIDRYRQGKRFSIVAVAEGAKSVEQARAERKGRPARQKAKASKGNGDNGQIQETAGKIAAQLAAAIEKRTHFETRVTALGHLQRGGAPTAADRILATRLGTRAAQLLAAGRYGVMVAVKGPETVPVPLETVAGRTKLVPPNHPLIASARMVGTCVGE